MDMSRISVAYRTTGARVVPVAYVHGETDIREGSFPGAQPVSFSERDLDRLVENEYVWDLFCAWCGERVES